MGTATSTRIDLAFARRAGVTRPVRLAARGLLRARVLTPDGAVARVALVQTAASLLRGDVVEIAVRCEPGTRVELVEVAGLVAHDVRGGATAGLRVSVSVGEGARLTWLAQPLVLAGGCAVQRATEVDVAAGGAVLLRDTLVLGRAGEEPGRLGSHLDVRHDGAPLHVEALDTGDLELLRSPAILGDAKVLDTLALYGARAPDTPNALALAGPGSVLPVPARSLAAAERTTVPALARWKAALFADDAGAVRAAVPALVETPA